MREGTASSTARLIAQSILLASSNNELRMLVADGEPEILDRILRKTDSYAFQRLMLTTIPRFLLLRLERMMLPGIITHYLVRKRRIERAVLEGITAGMGRVIVIGAGYDSLCLRLKSKFPEIEFIEIDHPATQKAKARAFPASGNFRYIPNDLTNGIPSNSLDFLPQSVVVIEGLTMYLEEKSMVELFQKYAPICGKLVFTFMEMDRSGSIDFRMQNPLIDSWLRKRGEPFLWGISKPALPAFLEKTGFKCEQIIDHVQLRKEFLHQPGLEKLPLAQGECICIATPLRP